MKTYAPLTIGQRGPRNTAAAAMRAIEESERAAKLLTTVGMAVLVRRDGGVGGDLRTTLTDLPWQLGHGAWVAKVAGIAGGYDCARIRPAAPPFRGEDQELLCSKILGMVMKLDPAECERLCATSGFDPRWIDFIRTLIKAREAIAEALKKG